MKKHLDLWIISLITLACCIWGAISFTGILDGIFLSLSKEDIPGLLILGLLGFVTVLAVFVPVWIVYGYIKVAIHLHRKGNFRKFLLWLILVPIILGILIATAVIYYLMTHQVCY